MAWTVHGERVVYESPWVSLALADVDTGDRRFEHHVVRLPGSVGTLVEVDGRVLMLLRHRFTTDGFGWELPGGWIDDDEAAATAAVRETEEETGWRPGLVRPLTRLEPITGISDAVQHVFVARSATWTGPPADAYESDRVAWIPRTALPDLLRRGAVCSGVSVAAIGLLLAGIDDPDRPVVHPPDHEPIEPDTPEAGT